MDEREYTLEELKRNYINHLVMIDRAPGTVENHELHISLLNRYLESQWITDIKKVELKTIEDFNLYLNTLKNKKTGRPLSSETIWNRLLHVCQFFHYLKKKGFIYVDPAEDFELPKQKKPLPKGIMTESQVKLILVQPDLKTVKGFRDRAMLEVLYSAGVRNGELRRLKIEDVDFTGRCLRINQGKGKKDRVVPFNSSAAYFLKKYLTQIRPQIKKSSERTGKHQERGTNGRNVLFITFYGTMFTGERITQIIKEYVKIAGLEKTLSCHNFRHTVATHLLENGMDIRYIQEFLGHRSLATTQKYTRVDKNKLREEMRKYHPREQAVVEIKYITDVEQMLWKPYRKGGKKK